jgi:hypothetical protein
MSRRIAGYAAPFVFGALVVVLFRNPHIKAEMKIDYYAYHRMWPEVLEAARDPLLRKHAGAVHTANRALYHTGRLGYDMFSYSQHPHLLFLTDRRFPPIFIHWNRIGTCLDLGQMNLAEYALNECTGMFGPRPILLKRLALVHMVKDNIPTARVYLNALARTLSDADWACGYLALLESDPALSTDRRIQHLRGLMIEKDRPVHASGDDPKYGPNLAERMLLELLERNPKNRMAFEYLMTFYMMNRRLDDLCRNLGRVKELGYFETPPLYEEAVLARALDGRAGSEQDALEVSVESRLKAEMFMGALNRFSYDGNPRHLDGFGNSYLYYHFCTSPPPGRKARPTQKTE